MPTVFETTCKQMQMDDSTNIEFTLWDTAGQEDYDKLRPLSYNGKHVVLICFSVDRYSFFSECIFLKLTQPFTDLAVWPMLKINGPKKFNIFVRQLQ